MILVFQYVVFFIVFALMELFFYKKNFKTSLKSVHIHANIFFLILFLSILHWNVIVSAVLATILSVIVRYIHEDKGVK